MKVLNFDMTFGDQSFQAVINRSKADASRSRNLSLREIRPLAHGTQNAEFAVISVVARFDITQFISLMSQRDR
ncbi:hypothetical protein M529_17355 [Sphingobium ummariense RL-3]|uniref:Uncharacterized protein n=1 Tax=Sphingobium ummariense RL-3 TaxID=1346791 RepID=T0K2S6_9SPHN|nr:hypothetical protein M529_17355 [Sphingobium ummariense RL-3]